ncbi:hypothetical protein MNAN1_002772 [Malassezia nana]|uniref:Uncharacterized protein n=1 Tax=Malassezia nana TaxID=180528 RepID=A0AAF0ESY5_9BASI|nr:hypothetical protein MNAN1_002772 [Malassezia nana]
MSDEASTDSEADACAGAESPPDAEETYCSNEKDAFPPSHTREPPARGILRARPPSPPAPTSGRAAWLSAMQTRLSASSAATSTGGLLASVLQRWSSKDGPSSALEAETLVLRRVHFRSEDLAHTYHIQGTTAPRDEAWTRTRIEKEASERTARLDARAWTPAELQSLYRVCCRAREEVSSGGVLRALSQASAWPDATTRTLDLAGLDLHAQCVPLADMLCVPLGVQVLHLDRCHLDDAGVTALARAVYSARTVHTLTLASNPNVRPAGWRMVGTLLTAAPHVMHLDVSEHDFSANALRGLLMPWNGSSCALQSLRLEACTLASGAWDVLAGAVQVGAIQHLSLRRHSQGARSALARLLRDYQASDAASISVWEHTCGAADELYLHANENEVETALLHGPDAEAQAASRRERREALMARAAAFQHALSELPRLGCLLTLDLKGSVLGDDLRALAAALRRNRTLRVLSLSECGVSPSGLACVAHALQYNTTLETLDLSGNPCCGTDLQGVHRLRVALGLHPRIRRVLLRRTQLLPAGAVALAECLPDTRALLHLDVAHNALGLVGLLALWTGLQRNASVRCLDVSLDAHDEYMAVARAMYEHCRARSAAAGAAGARFLDKSVLAASLREAPPTEMRAQTLSSEEAAVFRTTKELLNQ